MNVIISNEKRAEIANLDIEIIKSIQGVFEVDELIQMFGNFFFGRMILDLTAIKDFKDTRNLQRLSMSLDVEKIILLLPDTPECLAPQFLSKLISMGIYNFTTNVDGINYLLTNPNTYRDVAHLHQINEVPPVAPVDSSTSSGGMVNSSYYSGGSYILGIKNITDHSGATMLTYMLKNELTSNGRNVLAIEVGKKDFVYFNDKQMISIESANLASEILRNKDMNVIIVDLNKEGDEQLCNEVLYLIEPSTIKLNRLMRRDRKALEKLVGRKIVLSQSILTEGDVKQFEYETGLKLFYVMPPLDERNNNGEVLQQILNKLGVTSY